VETEIGVMKLALQTTDERSATPAKDSAARCSASVWLSAHILLSLVPIVPCCQPGCAAEIPKCTGRSVLQAEA
jgi:hypothetical protein